MSDDIPCLLATCSGVVERIERYKASVEWTRTKGGWELGAFDDGTHFHVFCSAGHELKRWGRDLPRELQRVVFPMETPPKAARPAVSVGAPHGKKAWDAYMKRFSED